MSVPPLLAHDMATRPQDCSFPQVNHIARICSDAEKSKQFYADLLGATILNRPNFPSPGYWLWLGNTQVSS